jgi:PhnB protein
MLRDVAQLVARHVRDVEAVGSSPAIPTPKKPLVNARGFFYDRFTPFPPKIAVILVKTTAMKNPAYNTVMPYLILPGAIRFLEFAREVFGARVLEKVMRDEQLIMHGEVQIGESIIMFADATETFVVQTTGLFVNVDDADAVYKKALAQGASAVTPISDQPYGRSGGILDPTGNTWWITSGAR